MRKIYCFLLAMVCLCLYFPVQSQVTFTQTTNDDFVQGTTYGVQVNNNSVTPEFSLAGGSINDWESTTNLPEVRYGHQLATWHNYLYCIGGNNASAVVNTVYRATFQASGISGWTTLTALPVALSDAAVACTQTYLVVMGGHTTDSICRNIYTAKFNTDGSISAWSTSPITLPQPLYGAKALFVRGNIYLIGGSTSDNASGYSNKVYVGKVNTMGELYALTETASLPNAVSHHAVATDGQSLYVTGGRNSSDVKQSTVLKGSLNLDGTVSGWQAMTALSTEIAEHTAVCSNGILAIIGGEDNSGLASNKLYYTYLNSNPFSWEIADVFLSDRITKAASIAYNNSVYVAGGMNMVGTALNYTRYAPISVGSGQVTDATFISQPYIIGDPKTVQSLTYTLSNSSTGYELLYRVAGMDKVYGNWTTTDNTNPLNINLSTSYLQYMMRFVSVTGTQPTLDDMTLTLSGITQLSGNLNSIDTLKVENSPYWVTGTISFTGGTHVIDSGVTIYFNPNTGLDITQANVKFNGTANAGITLTSYDHEVPTWNGVYFQDASDNGVTSSMTYTSVLYAGNGDNNANLRLHNTTQPTISNCNFSGADGHGIRLVNSHPSISNCAISNNTESGIYMEGANPTLNTVTSANNGFAGLYYANANVNPTITDITLSNNTYGIYSHTPDNSFAQQGQITMSANVTDVAVNGGTIGSDRQWGYFENGYALLGDVTIQSGSCPKLTIAPGNTIKVASGKYLNIGWGSNQGGKLSAMGKADSLITFTSLDGTIGGWNGLFFRDGSDYNSSSTLRYCVVEKGNDFNLYCENTAQPYILSCTFRNANNQDMRLNNSNITIESSVFQNAQYGLSLYNSNPILISDTFNLISQSCLRMENNNWPNIYSVVMKNSQYGILLPNPDYDIPHLNINFYNNVANIAIPGGNIENNRTWEYNSYCILGNITVGSRRSTARLTIKPGVAILFAQNSGLQIGRNDCESCSDSYFRFGGAIHAIGTSDSLITFTALNDSIGGWNGIYFRPESDDFGTDSSDIKYCIIEKGKDYNIHTSGTNMPYIDHCTFRFSNGHGLWLTNTYDRQISNSIFEDNAIDGLWNENCLIRLDNCLFTNNGRYGLHYNNSHYVDILTQLTISGNSMDGIIIDGGTIEGSRTWYYCEKPYYIMGNVTVGSRQSTAHLTIKPGVTILFAQNSRLQIGRNDCESCSDSWYRFGGAIHAIGTPDSLITFTALNDSIGGWNGIYFRGESDDYGSDSSDIKYCIIEKGKDYNLYTSGTKMPYIENSTFRQSNGYGLWIQNEYARHISHCVFEENASDGLWNQNCLVKIHDSQFINNGRYGVHYNNSHYVDSLTNLTISGNELDGIVIDGGTIEDNRTWFYCEKPYIFMDNITLKGRQWVPVLTLKPGCKLVFANNKGLQIGNYEGSNAWYHFGGALNAIGAPDSLITFSALNNSIGGWNGIYFEDRSDNFGGECHMTYVDVSQGKDYNVRSISTTFPTMEKCNIHHALGNGLQLESSPCVINSSSFHHNGNHGLFINGGIQPTIGGNYMDYCSFYQNQGYAVYQDGTAQINMPYSFFGCTDSLMVSSKYIYDKADNSSKGEVRFWPVSWVPQSVGEKLQINGTFTYGNSSESMSNVTVNIQDFQDNNLLQTTTDAANEFQFNDVDLTTANRMVFGHSCQYTDGAVNATDALKVMRHFTHQALLSPSQQSAADVNGSCTINGTDAMLILKRYVGLLNEFPIGNDLYICDSVKINDNNFLYNTYMYWYGDVDFSYTITRNHPQQVMLENYEMAAAPTRGEIIRIPVIAKGDYSVGAISLDIRYPEDALEILGATLHHTGDSLTFHTYDNTLRMGWYSLNALPISYNDTLLTITARVLSTEPSQLHFELGNCNELADGEAEPIADAILAMPNISDLLGIEDLNGGEGESAWEQVNVYPNPSHGDLTITDPEHIIGQWYLYDVCGKLIRSAASNTQESTIQIRNLTPGMYFVRLEAENSSKTIKVVVEK